MDALNSFKTETFMLSDSHNSWTIYFIIGVWHFSLAFDHSHIQIEML